MSKHKPEEPKPQSAMQSLINTCAVEPERVIVSGPTRLMTLMPMHYRPVAVEVRQHDHSTPWVYSITLTDDQARKLALDILAAL